jgi:hypothetical protein
MLWRGVGCFFGFQSGSWTKQISTDTKESSPVCLNLGHPAALSEKEKIIEKVVFPAADNLFSLLVPAHFYPLSPDYNFKALLINCSVACWHIDFFFVLERKAPLRFSKDYQALDSFDSTSIFFCFARQLSNLCRSPDSFCFLRFARRG